MDFTWMTVRGELLAYHSGMPKRLSCAVRRWYVVEQRVLTILPPTTYRTSGITVNTSTVKLFNTS